VKEKTLDSIHYPALFWKRKYERQKLLLNSVLSLLNKYGASLDLDRLHRELLLTSMGQFVATSSAYYCRNEKGTDLVPAAAYGTSRREQLPSIPIRQQLIDFLTENHRPFRLDRLPRRLRRWGCWSELGRQFQLAAPLMLKDKLIGIMLLGSTVTGRSYSENEVEFIAAFSSVSAITFNNASLLRNVRSSIREVQKLFDIRSELINRMTHEFRTPLTIIKAGLETLRIDAKYKKIYEGIEDSVNRLEDLIGNLLELNRTGYDFEEDVPVTLRPATLIQRCLAAHAQDAAAKGVTFSLRIPPEVPEITTRLSEERFLRVICNLIDNAIKYARPCTEVVIEMEQEPRAPDDAEDGRVLADWRKVYRKVMEEYRSLAGVGTFPVTEGGRVADRGQKAGSGERRFWVIRVSDSGIGIPQEDLDHIPEPFRMASNSPELGVRGKGLGLAVAMKLLAEVGGLLYCSTEVGKGSTFTAFLPTEKGTYVPD